MKNKLEYGKFYEIPKHSVLAEELMFLQRAVSDDFTRYFMQFIQVEESFKAIATDGRRLHIVKRLNKAFDEAYGMTPGKYIVKKSSGKEIWVVEVKGDTGQFPDYERVIPSGDVDYTSDCYGFGKTTMSNVVDLFYSFPEPTKIRIEYLMDIGSHHYQVKWRKANEKTRFNAIVFESDTRLAVIMPMDMARSNP